MEREKTMVRIREIDENGILLHVTFDFATPLKICCIRLNDLLIIQLDVNATFFFAAYYLYFFSAFPVKYIRT